MHSSRALEAADSTRVLLESSFAPCTRRYLQPRRQSFGSGVYSREILNGLAATNPGAQFDWFYRSQRYAKALRLAVPGNVTRRFLADGWGNRSAALFHGLNQRLPRRRFRRQIATFHDLFVLTGDYSTPDFRARFAAQARQAAAEPT